MIDNYHVIWLQAQGPGPWSCGFCGDPVVGLRRNKSFNGLIHHKDENRSNNDITNLVAMHRDCHVKHHLTGKARPAEVRKKIGQKRRRAPLRVCLGCGEEFYPRKPVNLCCSADCRQVWELRNELRKPADRYLRYQGLRVHGKRKNVAPPSPT